MRKLLAACSLLLVSALSFGAATPWFVTDGRVKAIKPSLDLQGQFYLRTGTADPTVTPVDAPRGSMYCRTGASGGTCYTKQDDGSTTSWASASYAPAGFSVSRMLWATAGGSNTPCPATPCGDGSYSRPYADPWFAQSTVSDASSSKIYSLMIGPATYSSPASGTKWKPWIYWFGSGRTNTFIQLNNLSSTSGLQPDYTTAASSQNFSMSNLTYQGGANGINMQPGLVTATGDVTAAVSSITNMSTVTGLVVGMNVIGPCLPGLQGGPVTIATIGANSVTLSLGSGGRSVSCNATGATYYFFPTTRLYLTDVRGANGTSLNYSGVNGGFSMLDVKNSEFAGQVKLFGVGPAAVDMFQNTDVQSRLTFDASTAVPVAGALTISQTCDTTAGSTTLTLASMAGVRQNDFVELSGSIPPGTKVAPTNLISTPLVWTMSQAATATTVGGTCNFIMSTESLGSAVNSNTFALTVANRSNTRFVGSNSSTSSTAVTLTGYGSTLTGNAAVTKAAANRSLDAGTVLNPTESALGISYEATTPANWPSPTPTLISTALDALAARSVSLDSSASAGGSASETLTVSGLLTTDTILSVTQKTAGANGTALTGWSNVVSNDQLPVTWTADPGAGAVVRVNIKR